MTVRLIWTKKNRYYGFYINCNKHSHISNDDCHHDHLHILAPTGPMWSWYTKPNTPHPTNNNNTINTSASPQSRSAGVTRKSNWFAPFIKWVRECYDKINWYTNLHKLKQIHFETYRSSLGDDNEVAIIPSLMGAFHVPLQIQQDDHRSTPGKHVRV